MKPTNLLAIVAVLLASSAWAQTLPKDSEIKVRTDTSIPAKPPANAKYAASISNDVTDSSGSVVIPRGSRAQLVAVQNGNDTTLDLHSVTVNGKRYVLTAQGKSSAHGGLGANQRTAKYVGGGAAVGAVLGALLEGARERRSEHWPAVAPAPGLRCIPDERKKFHLKPNSNTSWPRIWRCVLYREPKPHLQASEILREGSDGTV
jgi:hypothetical protein